MVEVHSTWRELPAAMLAWNRLKLIRVRPNFFCPFFSSERRVTFMLFSMCTVPLGLVYFLFSFVSYPCHITIIYDKQIKSLSHNRYAKNPDCVFPIRPPTTGRRCPLSSLVFTYAYARFSKELWYLP